MYSFEPSEDQKTIIESARKFASSELRARCREADDKCEPAREWLSAGWELGLLPASIPEKYGGFGDRSALTGVLAAEELAWGDLSGALVLGAPNLSALPVLFCGSEEQREKLLPLFCSNSYKHGSAALMEPHYDFDPNHLTTSAVRSGDGYVLSGTKCNVPYAAEAEWMVVYAACEGRTEGFLIRPGAVGVKIKEREQNMGMRSYPLYAVEFDHYRVPAAERLGGEAGCDFQLILNACRIAQCALALGVARAAFEYGRDYAKQRQAFGEAIARRQSIAFMLAEMAIDLEGARMMVWEAAWLLDQGKDATREACLAKNFTDDMALTVADRAVQILGGHGYINDYPVELWLRNARGFAVMDGIAIV